MSIPTVIVWLDDRRALKDGSFPVKLRITYKRKPKNFSTGLTSTKQDWEKVYSQKPREPYKTRLLKYLAIEQRARDVIEKLPVFTFELFERKFLDTASADDAYCYFDRYIEKLIKKGRLKTAISYESAMLSFIRFTRREPTPSQKGKTRQKIKEQKEKLLKERVPLPFTHITREFIDEYESWMEKSSHSPSTTAIYLRYLRAIFNEAINTGDVNSALYPFGAHKYKIKAGRNNKRALPPDELYKLLTYTPDSPYEAKALAYWTFSLFCNGINFTDMARLKYRNIDGNKLAYVRSKTYRTRHNGTPIRVLIVPEMGEVIDKWGNKPVAPDIYIFPILRDGYTLEQEMMRVQQVIKDTNKYMKQIAQKLKLSKYNVTTYVARHTHSKLQWDWGASAEDLKEGLGHDNITTTYQYIDSLDDKGVERYGSRLTGLAEKLKK